MEHAYGVYHDLQHKLREWMARYISKKLGRKARACSHCEGLGYELLQERKMFCVICKHKWSTWLTSDTVSCSQNCPGCGSVIGYPDNAVVFAVGGKAPGDPLPFKHDTFAAWLPIFEAFSKWMASDGSEEELEGFCAVARQEAARGRGAARQVGKAVVG